MTRRLDELDDEEAREIAAITDRYADVKATHHRRRGRFRADPRRRRRVGRVMGRLDTRGRVGLHDRA
jgi:hypothetical protein